MYLTATHIYISSYEKTTNYYNYLNLILYWQVSLLTFISIFVYLLFNMIISSLVYVSFLVQNISNSMHVKLL